jgi:hypothetical protein
VGLAAGWLLDHLVGLVFRLRLVVVGDFPAGWAGPFGAFAAAVGGYCIVAKSDRRGRMEA